MHYAKAKSLAKALTALKDEVGHKVDNPLKVGDLMSTVHLDQAPLLKLIKIVEEIVEDHAADDIRERRREIKA